jgi:hypothetical protein
MSSHNDLWSSLAYINLLVDETRCALSFTKMDLAMANMQIRIRREDSDQHKTSFWFPVVSRLSTSFAVMPYVLGPDAIYALHFRTPRSIFRLNQSGAARGCWLCPAHPGALRESPL